MGPVCRVARCDRKAQADGLCNAHYLRQLRIGTVDEDRPVGVKRRVHANKKKKRRILEVPMATRRDRLRFALAGATRWTDVPLPTEEDPDYTREPACGNFGCDCLSLRDVDRLVDRLVKL